MLDIATALAANPGSPRAWVPCRLPIANPRAGFVAGYPAPGFARNPTPGFARNPTPGFAMNPGAWVHRELVSWVPREPTMECILKF
ncbi:hypothetical protein SLEP1_g39920 [Rubroshorea leprosula]|uniref:Uncharacterized protein n=1 Tax=Rubroshorea leprosula TaxID=152421 RepID=A0AAV5L2A1_9ROSI|nr:hypothetical protein SLEP1_g39920 [Rubroshorea leprosula]